MWRIGRILGPTALVAALAAGCAPGGGLGGVLGGILNPAPSNEVAGTVSSVDTRSQQIYINTDNGQQIALQYDSRTQVAFQGQNYPVGNLERGDYVTARIQGTTNGGYYTDAIQVTQSAQSQGPASGNSGNYQTIEGTVGQINFQDGTFLLSPRNGASTLVTMPYNPRQTDVQRFNQLRNGSYVRVQGQYVGNGRFQLAGFM